MEEIFYEIFEDLPSQGPGDAKSTQKAFLKIVGLPSDPDILDIGCGVGRQTLDLAKLTSGRITALDNHRPFLEKLDERVQTKDLLAEIQTVQGDMAALNFGEESFDLIWSEGSAYIMGFEKAMKAWRPLLRPGGSLVISHIVWFKKDRPKEIEKFWAEEWPDIKFYKDNNVIVEESGYALIDYFPLPHESWWTQYYHPTKKKLERMRIKYKDNRDAHGIFDSFQLELDMHKKYSKYYGYGFYIMKRSD